MNVLLLRFLITLNFDLLLTHWLLTNSNSSRRGLNFPKYACLLFSGDKGRDYRILCWMFCSEKETPTSGTQILAQTLSIMTLYMKYYSQIYCSPRAIGDSSPKSDTAVIGRRHFFPKMAYHRLCSDHNIL